MSAAVRCGRHAQPTPCTRCPLLRPVWLVTWFDKDGRHEDAYDSEHDAVRAADHHGTVTYRIDVED